MDHEPERSDLRTFPPPPAGSQAPARVHTLTAVPSTGAWPVDEPVFADPHGLVTATDAPTAQRVEGPIDGAVPLVVEPRRQVSTTTARRIALDAIVVGLIGLGFIVVGLLAVIRAGLAAPLSTPVVGVAGFTHTALLGLVELGVGLCLLGAAATTSKGAAVFVGVVLGVAGFVGAFQTESFTQRLALESGWAWIAVVAAFVVVAASLLIPRVARSSTQLEVR